VLLHILDSWPFFCCFACETASPARSPFCFCFQLSHVAHVVTLILSPSFAGSLVTAAQPAALVIDVCRPIANITGPASNTQETRAAVKPMSFDGAAPKAWLNGDKSQPVVCHAPRFEDKRTFCCMEFYRGPLE
jgi:hypothetical protein